MGIAARRALAPDGRSLSCPPSSCHALHQCCPERHLRPVLRPPSSRTSSGPQTTGGGRRSRSITSPPRLGGWRVWEEGLCSQTFMFLGHGTLLAARYGKCLTAILLRNHANITRCLFVDGGQRGARCSSEMRESENMCGGAYMFRQFVAGCASVPGQISPSVPANEIRGSDAGQSNERGNWRISGETTDVVRPLAVTCPLLPRVRSSTSIKPPTLVTSILQLLPARPSSRHQVYLASSSWPSVPLLPVPAPVRASCTSWIPTGSGTTTGGASSTCSARGCNKTRY